MNSAFLVNNCEGENSHGISFHMSSKRLHDFKENSLHRWESELFTMHQFSLKKKHTLTWSISRMLIRWLVYVFFNRLFIYLFTCIICIYNYNSVYLHLHLYLYYLYIYIFVNFYIQSVYKVIAHHVRKVSTVPSLKTVKILMRFSTIPLQYTLPVSIVRYTRNIAHRTVARISCQSLRLIVRMK